MAVERPGAAEPDVRKTDAAPGEERSQAGQSEQPVEHGGPVGVEVDVSQAAKEQDDADAPERAARSVNVCSVRGGSVSKHVSAMEIVVPQS